MVPSPSNGFDAEAEAAKLEATAAGYQRESIAFAVGLVLVVALGVMVVVLGLATPSWWQGDGITILSIMGAICFYKAFDCFLTARLHRFAAQRVRAPD